MMDKCEQYFRVMSPGLCAICLINERDALKADLIRSEKIKTAAQTVRDRFRRLILGGAIIDADLADYMVDLSAALEEG